MNRLIDMACPGCGQVTVDVWVASLEPARFPQCHKCGVQVERAWAFVRAPGVTPQGTRPECGFDQVVERPVDKKAIAVDTIQEVEQKWLRYSDETLAEQHVSREINEAAGMADAMGNLLPAPTPPPITFNVSRE